MKLRALILSLAAIVTLLALRSVLDKEQPIPLISLRQGFTAVHSPGGPALVLREGSVLYVYSTKTRAGHRLQWCPYEELLWSPDSLQLWDRYGHVVRKGNDEREFLVRLGARLDKKLQVVIARDEPRTPPPSIPVKVPNEVLRYYEQWLNRANVPTTRRLEWCPQPVR